MMEKNIVHIAFGDSAAGCLREAIAKGMAGMDVVVSRDDFTQGPISETITDGGLVQRSSYWSSLEAVQRYISDIKSDYQSTLISLNNIKDNQQVLLWIGDSAHDILATSWLVTYLENKNLEWLKIDLKDAITHNELPLVNVAMLSPVEIIENYSLLSPMRDTELKYYRSLWENLSEENSAYRIKEEGNIKSVKANYYDDFILSCLTKKPRMLGKIMADVMRKSEHKISDVTIETRLNHLHAKKKIKIDQNLVQVYLSKVWKK